MHRPRAVLGAVDLEIAAEDAAAIPAANPASARRVVPPGMGLHEGLELFLRLAAGSGQFFAHTEVLRQAGAQAPDEGDPLYHGLQVFLRAG